MRQIIFDTETTGLCKSGNNIAEGHRVIEIGCIELVNRRPTGRHFHHYLNPEQSVDPEAIAVHGLTDDFLSQQAKYGDIHAQFMQYLDGADELIAHNMSFDQAFLNQELRHFGDNTLLEKRFTLVDTLAIARETLPGQRHSLDALCRHYGIDNSKRELHGALLDAELLAEVYLKLTGGQSDLLFQTANPKQTTTPNTPITPTTPTGDWLAINASATEQQAHQAILNAIQVKKPTQETNEEQS